MSHPDVERMTHSMWVVEALGIREMEREREERSRRYFLSGVRALRELLIATLGLNVGINKFMDAGAEDAEKDPEALRPFIPLIYAVARPEMLKHLLDRQAEASDIEQALNDKAFDELSEKLAKMTPGDMEPLLSATHIPDQDELATMLRALNIQQVDDPSKVGVNGG